VIHSSSGATHPRPPGSTFHPSELWGKGSERSTELLTTQAFMLLKYYEEIGNQGRPQKGWWLRGESM